MSTTERLLRRRSSRKASLPNKDQFRQVSTEGLSSTNCTRRFESHVRRQSILALQTASPGGGTWWMRLTARQFREKSVDLASTAICLQERLVVRNTSGGNPSAKASVSVLRIAGRAPWPHRCAGVLSAEQIRHGCSDLLIRGVTAPRRPGGVKLQKFCK